MLRLQGSTTVAPIDLALIQDALARAIERWRGVDFVGGRVVDPTTGGARDGLQVADGSHPREGVVYRVFGAVTAEPARIDDSGAVVRPTPTWQVSTVELVADRSRRVEVAVQQDGEVPIRARGEIGPHDRPGRCEASVHADLAGRWPVRGKLRIEVNGEIDEPDGSSSRIARVEARARHPRGKAGATVEVVRLDADRWEVSVAAQVRGRGILRPAAAVVLAVARRSVERSFREGLDKVAGQVADVDASLRTPDGSLRTPDDLATELITETIRSVPESVPDDVQRRR